MTARRRVAVLVVVAALAAPAAAGAETCPVAPDPSQISGTTWLRKANSYLDRLGSRPTASPSHAKFVEFLAKRFGQVPGMRIERRNYSIRRWTPTAQKLVLRVGDERRALRVAAPVPYTQATSKNGVVAPLALVAGDDPITKANAAGKLVVRPAPAGTIGLTQLLVVANSVYDPGKTFDFVGGELKGDFINYDKRREDLVDAAAAGAAGVLFVKELPAHQLPGHYEPYEGLFWKVPGAFLGADEGKALTDAIASGKAPVARLVSRASVKRVQTPTIIATLPGANAQKIVIDSHTDGTNAVEDNGPLAMLAMARYFAKRAVACRPRTIEFALSTAHFYQYLVPGNDRNGGALQVARRLDKEYDEGKVAGVVVIEHLGALEYLDRPRPDGVGRVLQLTGRPEPMIIAETISLPLRSAVQQVVSRYDMRRTLMIRGADVPSVRAPLHCSFGGEGTPFNKRLLPTVAAIAAPQTLYNPAFGIEGIDFGLMHRQMLAFTELIQRMGEMPQSGIGGPTDAFRALRGAGAPVCPDYP